MKHAISFLLFCLITFTLNAQTQKSTVQKRTSASDLVVEGKVIKCQPFWNETHTQILTSNLVEVFKVFKGNLVGDRFEIITKGGRVDDRFSIVSHQTTFKVGMEGMFFCKTSEKLPSLGESANKPCIMAIAETGYIQYYFNRFNPPAADKSASYQNIKREIWDEVVLSCREPVRKIKPNTLEEKVQDMFNILPENETEFLSGPSIFFTFENVSFSNDYQKIVFDVYAHCSENGVKFGKAAILINYSGEVFGENAVATGNVDVSKGIIIQNSGYTLTTSDAAEEEVFINVASPFLSPSSAYVLTTVGEQFCHVELKIENLLALANIGFDEFQMSGNCWYFDPSTGLYTLFERVGVDSPIDGSQDPNDFVIINYEFDDIFVSELAGNKYLEFDINAFSNVSWTRLAVSSIFIGYNPDAFGNNPVSSGNFSYSVSPVLQALGYTSSPDHINGHIRVFTSQTSPDSLKYVLLPTTPINIVHCKLKILNCDENAGVTFGAELMNTFPQYYFGGLPILYIEYDGFGEEGLVSFYDQFLCKDKAPIVTKITPKDLRAGKFEVLTVRGQNLLLSDTLLGKFYFRDSERPDTTVYDYAYDQDVISWNDTLIEIYVPSDLANSIGSSASGKIIVENALGNSAKSDEEIGIQYSLTNRRDQFDYAQRISFVNANSEGGYTWEMDDELISYNPDVCIIRGLKEWSCETSINWKLSNSGIFGLEDESIDGNSTLVLGNLSGADSNALAYTALAGHVGFPCDNGLAVEIYYVDDIDIVFDKNRIFQLDCDSIDYSGNTFDFYSVLVHELGHAHMLEHSVDNGSIVYAYNSPDRYNPNGNDIAGGKEAIRYSLEWDEGGDCPMMHDTVLCGTTGLLNVGNNLLVKIYPNPIVDELFVEGGFDQIGDLHIDIFDITGRLIVSNLSHSRVSDNKFLFSLPRSNLPDGIFLARVRNQNYSTSFKLIKNK